MEAERKKRYIYNWNQALFYMTQYGIEPIEVPQTHTKTLRIFFTFDDEETKVAYDAWCSRERQ